MLKRGLKEFMHEGKDAAKCELSQMHQRRCYRAIAVKELTRQERQRAVEGLMLLTRKKSGDVKGRLAYNGKPTRKWITKEEKSSPTVLTDSIMLTYAIDANQRRDIMTLDVPNAFIQTGMPPKKVEEQIIMKVRGVLVDWLVEINPLTYSPYVVIERGEKVLYLEILRAIYGMLEASLLWYRKFKKELEEIGFEFNDYDPCVANRKQSTYHSLSCRRCNVVPRQPEGK